MKTNYLFPYSVKKIGWILFVPSFLMGVLFMLKGENAEFLEIRVPALVASDLLGPSKFFTVTTNTVSDEIIGLFLIVGAILIALSKQKEEDEFISKIRLESLVWATYVNYAILLLAILLVYGMTFFWVLVFNMFTVLMFFIVRFNWAVYKSRKNARNEE